MSESQPKIKITVLKVFQPEEVFKENPPMRMLNPGPCSVNKEGESWIVEGFNQPEGICGHAWGSIWPYFMMLKNGGEFPSFYDEPGVAAITCPDGLRPVLFRVERI